MRPGKPVVIHGDGTSLWTITHTDDFAVAFTGLLGNPAAIGEAFTITGTHAPTWNQIYGWLADAAGVAEPDFVHVASDDDRRVRARLGSGLLGDKAHSVVFDNEQGHGAGAGVPHDDHVRRGRAPDHRALRRAPRRAAGRRGRATRVRPHRGLRPVRRLTPARPSRGSRVAIRCRSSNL